MVRRICFNILCFLSVLLLPVLVAVAVLVLAIFLCDAFVEAVGWAFLIDTLYSDGTVFGITFHYPVTACMLLVLCASLFIKRMMTWYPRP